MELSFLWLPSAPSSIVDGGLQVELYPSTGDEFVPLHQQTHRSPTLTPIQSPGGRVELGSVARRRRPISLQEIEDATDSYGGGPVFENMFLAFPVPLLPPKKKNSNNLTYRFLEWPAEL